MTYNDYILTLDGKVCIVWISELSLTLQDTDKRFALAGMVEAHDDFIVIHGDDSGAGTAVKIADIKCIETCDVDEDEDLDCDLDLSADEDIFENFERDYWNLKGE